MGEKSSNDPENGEEKLYEILLKSYTLVKERNDAYVTRAQNLLGFAGVIDTILVAIIVGLAAQKDIKEFFETSVYRIPLLIIITIGFLFYMASSILALVAYRTTPYKHAPEAPSMEYIQNINTNPKAFSIRPFSIQLQRAIDDFNKRNTDKYKWLSWATTFLVAAIISTAALGIFIIQSFLYLP